MLALAALMSVWLEWSFPQLLGIRVGIVDVAVIGGFLGLLFSSDSGPKIGDMPFRGLVFCYMCISLISLIANNTDVGIDKMIWGAYKEIYVSALFFLFYMVIRNKSSIEKTLNLVLLSSVFVSLIAIVQGVTQTIRAFGTFGHPNECGAFLIWPLSISIALFLVDNNYGYRKFLPYAICLQGFALILTQSRAGWAGFFLSASIICLFTKYYKKKDFIAILLSGAVFLFVIKPTIPDLDLVPGNITGRFLSVQKGKEDAAMKPRVTRWDYYYNKSFERPWFGSGSIVGEAELEKFSGDAPTPHNTYLSVAVKRGYLGLGIILLIFFRFGVSALKLYKTSRDTLLKALGLGIFAGFLGVFGVAGQFGSFLEETQINILLWCLLALTIRSKHLNHKIQS